MFFISTVISECYSDGDFRLVTLNTSYFMNGSVTVSGRIEVCTNRSYSSVCDYVWDPVDALVFCRNYLQNFFGIFSSNISEFD